MEMAAAAPYEISKAENSTDTIIRACNELYQTFDRVSDLLQSAVRIAATLLDADFTAIYWQNDENRVQVFFYDRIPTPSRRDRVRSLLAAVFAESVDQADGGLSLQRAGAVSHSTAAAIRMKKRTVGLMYAEYSSLDRTERERRHEILTQFAMMLEHAIEYCQMRQLLRSRYAAFALCQNAPQKDSRASLESHILASVQHPEKVAKIIARSFYKDLRRAGFEPREILVVASELIENLNLAFQRTQQKTRESS